MMRATRHRQQETAVRRRAPKSPPQVRPPLKPMYQPAIKSRLPTLRAGDPAVVHAAAKVAVKEAAVLQTSFPR